jgi:FlaA1/EpsC-like NDP-sugar epimerase
MKTLLPAFRLYLAALFHVGLIALSLAIAFLLRFDFELHIPEILQRGLWIAVPFKIVVFLVARLHRSWWSFADITDLVRVFWANVVASSGFTAVVWVGIGPPFPRSIYVIDFVLCFMLTAGARFAMRLISEGKGRFAKTGGKVLLIYGAGSAGRMMLREIRANPSLGYEVIGFLDDDPKMVGAVMMNVRVLGVGRDAAGIVDRHRKRSRKIEEIVIAMPSATERQMREAVANCLATGVTCKLLAWLQLVPVRSFPAEGV